MPLQTHRNKEDKKMYKVLLETGELKEFRTLKAAIRKSVVINGKKQILYISENVGFGPDTNTLIFDNEYDVCFLVCWVFFGSPNWNLRISTSDAQLH